MELRGARVLVTGASSGIGAALAADLGAAGATVGLVARREGLLAEVLAVAKRAGACPKSRYWVADLADVAHAEDVARAAWDAFGHLDALVNNAAVPKRRHATALDGDELDLVLRVNASSPARMALAVLPRMLARGAGCIVNVGSLGGRMGIGGEAAYCASKFALSGFTESLAIDLARTGVRAHLVTPGPFDTGIWDQPGEDAAPYDGPKYPPSQASAAIVAVLRGDAGFETVVPADLGAVVEWKAANLDAYLAGATAMAAGGASARSDGGDGG